MEWIKREYAKISFAFKRVKEDILSIKKYIERNEREIERLHENNEKLILIVNELKNSIKNLTGIETKVISEKREIIGNIDSKKFHYDDCPFGKKIKKENRIVFKNIDDALKHGFDECVCINEDN